MTVQQIINPSEIESRLKEIWDDLGKNQKMIRACLFNLIVYTKMSDRSDYFRRIVQCIVEKFPSRILFISADTNSKENYLKTAVSVVTAGEKENTIACDNIDIAVAGKDDRRVPFVLLPHIIPDLPVYLVWAEDPCQENLLFEQLEKFAHRIIFDSEAADNLEYFAQALLHYEEKHLNIADMNWARTEHWRDLLAATFYSTKRLQKLRQAQRVQITYNAEESEYFSHVKIQSLYLQAWLASRLDWELISSVQEQGKEVFSYQANDQKITIELTPKTQKSVKAGAIVSVQVVDKNNEIFLLSRNPDNPSHISVEVSSEEKCELPHHFILPESSYGQSLVKEITYHNTSQHFLITLKHILKKNQDT